MNRLFLAGTIVALAAGMVACFGPTDANEDRMTRQPTTQASPDPETIATALRFGGISLPPSATVLAVAHDTGIDERYRLVATLPATDLQRFLTESGFATPPSESGGPFQDTIAGYDLPATGVQSASDSLPPADGRTRTVFRELAIDRRTADRPAVHLWLFTT